MESTLKAKPLTTEVIEARIKELDGEIKTYEDTADRADSLEQMAACVAARKTATMLREQRANHKAELKAGTITDPLRKLEFMRARSSAAGSWVAAKDLYREERELRAEIDAAVKKAAEEAAKDVDKLMEEMDRVLTDLPESLRVKLLAKWMR